MADVWLALDATPTPEWLVIPEGQQSGDWRLLHNSKERAFFCTSRGAMCAGSAQVTLVELRRSYYTGCNPNRRNQKKPTKPNKTQKPQEEGSNLLRNSCGHGGRMRRGETGAMNSAKLSVHLVPQQLISTCLAHGKPGNLR